jgi:Ca2+-binding RTX toxin-like protein
MAVDPADDCTFWYTNEYLAFDNAAASSRIVSFRFAGCPGPGGPDRRSPWAPFVSADRRPHRWAPGGSLRVRWSGAADDASGVAGFSYVLDRAARTVPDRRIDAPASSTSQRFAIHRGGAFWFHIRVRDAAGNWTRTTHLGPFLIDPRCTVGGTDRADRLRGTSRRDVICGFSGNDRIDARGGGRDVVYGGRGRDSATVDGSDRVVGVERVRRR